MKVRWSPLASLRLIEIEEYVADDDPLAAERLVCTIVDKASKLADHPERGRHLPELPGSAYRELIVGNYRVIYRPSSKTIDILTLLRPDEL